MVAAGYGKSEFVRYLTELGADINIRNAKTTTLLFTTLLHLVVCILSSYYWVKECLLT